MALDLLHFCVKILIIVLLRKVLRFAVFIKGGWMKCAIDWAFSVWSFYYESPNVLSRKKKSTPTLHENRKQFIKHVYGVFRKMRKISAISPSFRRCYLISN